MSDHERKVSRFYAAGISRDWSHFRDLHQYDEGYLNFGYWKGGVRTYLEAAKALISYFIDESGIREAPRILNVCCGFGSETFDFNDRFHPERIVGLDLTEVNVYYANKKAVSLNLDDRIRFTCGDAVRPDFPDRSFSHVFGIEGIANFNTRERFFREAARVLEEGGVLMLTDIIKGTRCDQTRGFARVLIHFTAGLWHMPRENLVDEREYREQLDHAGFSVEFFRRIGNVVFPGYARNSFTARTIRKRIEVRGLRLALLLMPISWMLGYLSRKDMIEYIYVKAVKR